MLQPLAITFPRHSFTRVLLFLALLTSSVRAQTAYSFKEDFDTVSKTWDWFEVDDQNYFRKVTGGKHVSEHRSNSINWTMTHPFVDPTKPFEIEMQLVVKESQGAGVGIVVNVSDDRYYHFIVAPAVKKYWVGYHDKKEWVASRDWTEDSRVPGNGEPITLLVRGDKDKIAFLVNGQAFYESNRTEGFKYFDYVHALGIVSHGPMKFETDHFYVRQDLPKPNFVRSAPIGKPVRLPNTINRQGNGNFVPVISHDGQTLYFTRDKDSTGVWNQDIWYSKRHPNGEWQEATYAGYPLNNKGPNNVISVTPDNNTLILLYQYSPTGESITTGISRSDRKADGTWSMPINLVIKDFYNRDAWVEMCLSPDRKVLIMAIDRNDTYGHRDLYASFLQPDGTFGTPFNMGPVLNTFGWEVSPFVAGDGSTLYFASGGRPGLGSNDIYMSRRLDETWTKWSEPVNLGPPINTAGWDAYFTIPAAGDLAYLVSSRESKDGLSEIFRIALPPELRPEPAVLISGRVLDASTKQIISTGIRYSDLATKKELGLATSSPLDGSYKIVLKTGVNYGFLAEKEGYYPVSQNLDLTKLTEYKEITRDLLLAPIRKGEIVRLNNLFFDFNKSELRKESEEELDRLVDFLKQNNAVKIELAGHTDDIGTPAANQKLSLDRVTSVKAYLRSRGITQDRLTLKAYGESKPLSKNTTEEGRQENRRVEFRIL